MILVEPARTVQLEIGRLSLVMMRTCASPVQLIQLQTDLENPWILTAVGVCAWGVEGGFNLHPVNEENSNGCISLYQNTAKDIWLRAYLH